MVFPVVMYVFPYMTSPTLWCWRRLLRVPWTARRSDQSILEEISPVHLEKPSLTQLSLSWAPFCLNKFFSVVFKDFLAQLLLCNQCLSFKISQQAFHIYQLHLFSIPVPLSSFLLVNPNHSPDIVPSLILVYLGFPRDNCHVKSSGRIIPFSMKWSQQYL